MFDTIAPRSAVSSSAVLPPDMIISKMQPLAGFPQIQRVFNDKLTRKTCERSTASTCSSSSCSGSSLSSQDKELFQQVQQELRQAELDEQHGEEPQDSSVPKFVSSEEGSLSGSGLLDELACEQDVVDLLKTIRDALEKNEAHQHDMQEKAEARFDMACGRVVDGCKISAKMATRRMHRVRVELGRVSVVQCRLMEMYCAIHEQWSIAQSTAGEDQSFMVDVDVQHYLDFMAKIQDDADSMAAVHRTDEEMMEEVTHMCLQEED